MRDGEQGQDRGEVRRMSVHRYRRHRFRTSAYPSPRSFAWYDSILINGWEFELHILGRIEMLN